MSDRLQILNGDCREMLKTLPDCSLDSCLTDPPYELGFMNKRWDKSGVAYDVKAWAEVLRVLKPGAHLLAFGGTRTAHRLAVAIEDAGFEIRDSIHWCYGSGFPKSLDVSKAIDKAAGVERTEVIGSKLGRPGMAKDGSNQRSGFDSAFGGQASGPMSSDITAPATELARIWQGFGTALKPAHEIIYLARKPLSEPNVAANVLKWGTGALNIDGCRIGTNHWTKKDGAHSGSEGGHLQQIAKREAGVVRESNQGRWPSNFILSHDPNCNGSCVEGCPVAELDRQSGELSSGHFNGHRSQPKTKHAYGEFRLQDESPSREANNGGASRFYHIAEWSEDDFIPLFFYVAKASRDERDAGLSGLSDRTMNRVNPGGLEHDPRWGPIEVKNSHPTVKPVSLMAYLARLITPPGGTVLDCFAGSGTTGRAAMEQGFKSVLIEQDPIWLEVINARCATQMGLSL